MVKFYVENKSKLLSNCWLRLTPRGKANGFNDKSDAITYMETYGKAHPNEILRVVRVTDIDNHTVLQEVI